MNVATVLPEIGKVSEQSPYYPFSAARALGIIANPRDLARSEEYPLGLTVFGGRLPDDGAGIVEMANGFVAVDHTATKFSDSSAKELTILPADKDSVSEGEIIEEGSITIDLGDGRIKLFAFALDAVNNYWFIKKMRDTGNRVSWVGELAIVANNSLDNPFYEIQDITSEGIISAREYRRIF